MHRNRGIMLGFVFLASAGLMLFAAPARADIEYASGVVSLLETGGGTAVPGSSPFAGAFGTPDGSALSLSYPAQGAPGTSYEVDVNYSFTGYRAESGRNRFFVVVDGTPTGVVTGRIVGWNGTAPTAFDVTTLNGTGNVDTWFPIYSEGPTAADTITSVTVKYFLTDVGAGSSVDIDTVANPEPGTLALFGAGLVGLGLYVRRRRGKKTAA